MLEKINNLIGKKFNYKGVDITITKVKNVNGVYVVMTDKKTYNFFENEVEIFIDNLIPITSKQKISVVVNEQLELAKMGHTPNTPNTLFEKKNDLSDVLYDAIDKVREDKNYIGQANAICNIVSQMINIKKLELQLLKKA